jgi:hypothetical protein
MKQRCIPSFCAFEFSNRRFVCGLQFFNVLVNSSPWKLNADALAVPGYSFSAKRFITEEAFSKLAANEGLGGGKMPMSSKLLFQNLCFATALKYNYGI